MTNDLRRCFQIMECTDRRLLDEWMANWQDIAEFEVVPVMTSADAATAVARDFEKLAEEAYRQSASHTRNLSRS